jgi:hypothetical protein
MEAQRSARSTVLRATPSMTPSGSYSALAFELGPPGGGPADRDWTRSHGVGGEMVRLSRHTDGGRVVSMHTDN